MQAEDIKDAKSLEAWLVSRPREDSIAVATRAVLRVFPTWGAEMDEPWARESGLLNLSVLRPLLASGGARNYPQPWVRASAAAAAAAANAAADATSSDAASFIATAACSAAAASSFENAAHSVTDAALAAAYAANAANSIQAADDDLAWEEIRNDAELLARGEDPFAAPLWSTEPPAWFTASELKAVAAMTREFGDANSFWHRWWHAMKRGEPLDWDLQRDIAAINDAIWWQGSEAVMVKINAMILAYLLRLESAAIRAKLTDLMANTSSLGRFTHNGPPVDDEAPSVLYRRLKEIDAALLEIEEELETPEPDPVKLEGLGAKLLRLWNALSLQTKIVVGAITISVASGFFNEIGADLYQSAKINIPSFVQRVSAYPNPTAPPVPLQPTIGPR